MSEPTAAAAAAPEVPQAPDVTLTPSSTSSSLGPAVTPDFPPVVGLQELIKQPGVAKLPKQAAPAEPPPPTVKVEPKLFLSTLTLLDRIASQMLKVDHEPDDVLLGVADAITPIAEYYAAKGENGIAVAWANLGVALVGVGFMKYQKVAERKEAERVKQQQAAAAEPSQETTTDGKAGS
jgi:hypothetical protein